MNNLPAAYQTACSNWSTLFDMVITPKAVEEKLRILNCNKSQGADGILARVLNELSRELALPISILCNKLIESGVLPLHWKTAIVTPVFSKEHIVTQTIIDQLILHEFCGKYLSQLSGMLL